MSKDKPKQMSNHIEEYFAQTEGSKESIISRELFKADDESIDLKTHLQDEEIVLINVLMFNNQILIERGLKPVFQKWIHKFMRLKVSKDRLSRGEFVNVNKQHTAEDTLSSLSNAKNIISSKK